MKQACYNLQPHILRTGKTIIYSNLFYIDFSYIRLFTIFLTQEISIVPSRIIIELHIEQWALSTGSKSGVNKSQRSEGRIYVGLLGEIITEEEREEGEEGGGSCKLREMEWR